MLLTPNKAVLYKNETMRGIGEHFVYRQLEMIFTIKTDKTVAQEIMHRKKSFLNEKYYSIFSC